MEKTAVTFNTIFPAVIFIVLTFVFLTVAVWSQRKLQVIKGWHMVFFVFGAICNLVSVIYLFYLSHHVGKSNTVSVIAAILSVIIACLQTAWSIWAGQKGSDRAKRNFTRFSFVVWIVWAVLCFGALFITSF